MAKVPLPDDDSLSNLYIDKIKGIAIQEDQPTANDIVFWVQTLDDTPNP